MESIIPTSSGSPNLTVIGNTSLLAIRIANHKEQHTIGGAGFNIAAAAAATGVIPTLVTVIGSDFPHDGLTKLKQICTPEHIYKVQGATAKFEYEFKNLESEPTVRTKLGIASRINEVIPSSFNKRSWVHVSCRRPVDSEAIVANLVIQPYAGISLDFTLSSVVEHLEKLKSHLTNIDLLFLNEAENELAKSILKDSKFSGLLVVTYGSDGATVFKNWREVALARAVPVRATDPSGAGDSLTGAFLAQMLKGYTIQKCLSQAVSIATMSLSGPGVESLIGRELQVEN